MNASVRSFLDELREAILTRLPESRERSLALTKLDECEMWLVRETQVPKPVPK